MSNLKQIQIDTFNAWHDRFMANIRRDAKNLEESKFIAKMVLDAEKLRGHLMVTDKDLEQSEFMVKVGYGRCKFIGLPVTAAGLAILLLGCNSPGDIVMNVMIAKKQYELLKDKAGPLADAEFMMPLFGQGCIDQAFYSEMWDLQKVGGTNMLDVLTPEHFQQTAVALV